MKSTNGRDNIVKWRDDEMKIQIENDIWPWIATGIVALLLITYIPDLILFLPKLMGYVV